MNRVGIIGGGASGIVAALEASDAGACVTIIEKKDRIGKKILVTGNGRCNFTNASMGANYYYTDDVDFVSDILSRFGNKDLIDFFMSQGLLIKEKNGYFYPACEQASAVLDVLRNSLKERNIEIITDENVIDVEKRKNDFKVSFESGSFKCFDKVVLACGGKSGLNKKDTHNGYDLCNSLGHTITKLYPALTQIKCEGLNFKSISGVKSDCELYLFSNDDLLMHEAGEVLFTDSGISGIVSFQVSHCAAKNLDDNKKVSIVLDLLPSLTEDNIKNFVASKYLLHEEQTVEEFLTGIQNKKINIELLHKLSIKTTKCIKDIGLDALTDIVLSLKEIIVEAKGVNSFEQAQVTGGGVPLSEVTSDLESKIVPGAFIVGELLDVDGICGGYNLQWAFSTGILAGRKAGI